MYDHLPHVQVTISLPEMLLREIELHKVPGASLDAWFLAAAISRLILVPPLQPVSMPPLYPTGKTKS